VLPGALVIWTLSVLYAGFSDFTVVHAVFFGIKAAVLAVVVIALSRIGKRVLKNGVMFGLAAAAFVAIFFFDVPFPVIIAAAALIGFIGGRVAPDRFVVIEGHGSKEAGGVVDAALDGSHLDHTRPSALRAAKVAAIWLPLWLGPLALLAITLGLGHVFTQEGVFFSKMAVVTFGGAYAVLAYVAQQAVDTYGWLKPGEMLDGLGLAETTPGPLIMVLQFVGFLAAFRKPGGLDPIVAGTLGAIITTWMTFAPCFLWIFLGAPYIEALRGNKALSAALSAITAAVVGVVLNLAVWFALHVMFGRVEEVHAWGLKLQVPEVATIDLAVAALAAAAFVVMIRFKANMLLVLAGCAAVGAVIFYARA
jgi:chromate transporter